MDLKSTAFSPKESPEKPSLPKVSPLDVSQNDIEQEEKKKEDDLDSNHVIEEEIIYSKGKQRIKQKIVKLRDYDIQQQDYAHSGVLVYHIDRVTMLHEDDQRYEVIKNHEGDQQNSSSSDKKKEKNGQGEEKVSTFGVQKYSGIYISAPLIT